MTIAALALVLSTIPSQASAATYDVTVVDCDGEAPIAEAVVVMKHQLTNQSFQATTGLDGVATFVIPNGPYNLSIDAREFQPYSTTVQVIGSGGSRHCLSPAE